jgi:hypothetical protein
MFCILEIIASGVNEGDTNPPVFSASVSSGATDAALCFISSTLIPFALQSVTSVFIKAVSVALVVSSSPDGVASVISIINFDTLFLKAPTKS